MGTAGYSMFWLRRKDFRQGKSRVSVRHDNHAQELLVAVFAASEMKEKVLQ